MPGFCVWRRSLGSVEVGLEDERQKASWGLKNFSYFLSFVRSGPLPPITLTCRNCPLVVFFSGSKKLSVCAKGIAIDYSNTNSISVCPQQWNGDSLVPLSRGKDPVNSPMWKTWAEHGTWWTIPARIMISHPRAAVRGLWKAVFNTTHSGNAVAEASLSLVAGNKRTYFLTGCLNTSLMGCPAAVILYEYVSHPLSDMM